MKRKIWRRVLAAACLAAAPWVALTQTAVAATPPGAVIAPKLLAQNFTVEATHTRAVPGQCTRIWVVVRGQVRGTYDRGFGLDGIWLSVWDDGLVKGAKWFAVPLSDDFSNFVAVLGYEKIFGRDRDPGITIYAGWADGDGTSYQTEDFATTEIEGSCNDPFNPPAQPVLPWAEVLPPGANPAPDQPDIPWAPLEPGGGSSVAPIPTLSPWALALLGAGVVATAVGAGRRRKKRG